MVFKLKKINPIARLIAYTRRRKQIVPPKKGKGSYSRKNKNRRVDISANCYIRKYHLTKCHKL